MALLTIGTSSLALVAFPQLAGRYANEGKVGFGEHFSLCARRMALILVPIAIGVSLFATPIVRDLLEGGEFTLEDSQTLGMLVTLMMGLFIGASVAELVSRGFYVLGDTRTPTLIGVICLVVCLFIRYFLYVVDGARGLSLGISIYFVVTAVVLTIALRRRVGVPVLEGLGRALVQTVGASLAACGLCFLVYHWKLGGTWVAGPIGCISYCLALLAMQNDDAKRAAIAVRLKASALMRGLNSD
jgi:peptidoglycan biosynthesis protein MviN/MurJ (putative lipid II flippase)